MRIVTKGTEIIAAGLAKVCQRPCAATRTAVPSIFALLALLLGGCSGGCSREQTQTPPEESVVKRMADPAYVKQLNDLRAEQSEIAERASAISKELEAARAEDPESAKTRELEKKHAAVLVEMEAARAKALVAVRNRMLQDEAGGKGK